MFLAPTLWEQYTLQQNKTIDFKGGEIWQHYKSINVRAVAAP